MCVIASWKMKPLRERVLGQRVETWKERKEPIALFGSYLILWAIISLGLTCMLIRCECAIMACMLKPRIEDFKRHRI